MIQLLLLVLLMVEAIGWRRLICDIDIPNSRLLFRLLQIAMIDALVIAQAIQRTVDPLAYVAYRLLGGAHVYVLDVPLQSCQRAEVLVARIAPEVIATAGGTITARGVQAGI